MSDHDLRQVSEFTHHTVGWERPEGSDGGQTPIREPLAEPYWRWYCSCGNVGGKSSSRAVAEKAHQSHQEALV